MGRGRKGSTLSHSLSPQTFAVVGETLGQKKQTVLVQAVGAHDRRTKTFLIIIKKLKSNKTKQNKIQ